MIHALGYSSAPFDPNDPGRLCRGRERWIEGFPIDPCPPVHRLVISGASFSDDTASDALRGLPHAGIGPGELLEALFPNQAWLAFREQGDPALVPQGAILAEPYLQPRFGGNRFDPCVRWRLPVQGAPAIDAVFPEPVEGQAGPPPEKADGLVPFGGELSPGLEESLFLLTGQSDRFGLPEQRLQPTALPGLLALVPCVVVQHEDKHGPTLTVYHRDPLDVEPALQRLAVARGLLLVPFSIPPMLARWDRALFELRLGWERGRQGSFPVPPGREPDLGARATPDEEE